MKLKNRDWTDVERRLEATGSQILQDRTVRTGLLALAILGMAALAWMAVYLICLSPPFQDSDPAAKAIRSWRSL